MPLNEESARAVLALDGRMSVRKLAQKFGVSKTAIQEVLTGHNWKRLRVDTSRPKSASEALFRQLHPDPAAWITRALEAVRRVAERYVAFTSDDVWAELDQDTGAGDNRTLGPVMKLAAVEGYCSATDRTQKSARKSCRHPVRVWRSEL